MKRLAVIAVVLIAACVWHIGPTPESYQPAHSANGVMASLALATVGIDGELLEVRDTALVLLARDRVALVPFTAVASGVFDQSTVTVGYHRAPLPADFMTLRMLSRYPQGIPPEALRRLLASKKQDSIAVVR